MGTHIIWLNLVSGLWFYRLDQNKYHLQVLVYGRKQGWRITRTEASVTETTVSVGTWLSPAKLCLSDPRYYNSSPSNYMSMSVRIVLEAASGD